MGISNRMTEYIRRKGGSRLSNFASSLSINVRTNDDPSGRGVDSGESQSRGNGRDNGPSSNSRSRNSTANQAPRTSGGTNSSGNNNGTSNTTTSTQRRRRPRGWWPASEIEAMKKKRGEIQLKAMKDLKDETFVVSEENFEWVFDDEEETLIVSENEEAKVEIPEVIEPQCYLILPMASTRKARCHSISSDSVHSDDSHVTEDTQSTHFSHCAGKTSNECAICMLEYDVGNVVVYSKRCGHAFHQECILDWFSREKSECPNCRAVFWEPKERKKKECGSAVDDEENEADSQLASERGGRREESGAENLTNRARSDAANIEFSS